MNKLFEKLKEKYDIHRVEDTKLVGHSSTIILENHILEIEETETIEPLRIEFFQSHKENKPCDTFKVSIVNCAISDEVYDLFWTNSFERIDNFISSIIINS